MMAPYMYILANKDHSCRIIDVKVTLMCKITLVNSVSVWRACTKEILYSTVKNYIYYAYFYNFIKMSKEKSFKSLTTRREKRTNMPHSGKSRKKFATSSCAHYFAILKFTRFHKTSRKSRINWLWMRIPQALDNRWKLLEICGIVCQYRFFIRRRDFDSNLDKRLVSDRRV